MKFEIKSRFSGAVLFSLETDSLKLCVEAAVKSRADLRGADLRGADLGGADLRGAYLGGAYLGGAKISLPNGSESLLVGERPIIRVGPIGSRADELLAFITDAGVFVRTGCFWGSLAEFEAKVAEMHGKTGPHAEEYHAAIGMIQWHAHHWTPKVTP